MPPSAGGGAAWLFGRRPVAAAAAAAAAASGGDRSGARRGAGATHRRLRTCPPRPGGRWRVHKAAPKRAPTAAWRRTAWAAANNRGLLVGLGVVVQRCARGCMRRAAGRGTHAHLVPHPATAAGQAAAAGWGGILVGEQCAESMVGKWVVSRSGGGVQVDWSRGGSAGGCPRQPQALRNGRQHDD